MPTKGEKSKGKKERKPKPANPRPTPVQQRKVRVPRLSVSPYLRKVAQQAMLPGDVSSPTVFPSERATQLCSRIIRKSYVLKGSDIDAQGRSMILMTPDMNTPASILNTDATLVPVAPGLVLVNSLTKFEQPETSDGCLFGAYEVSDGNGTVVKSATRVIDGHNAIDMHVSVNGPVSLKANIGGLGSSVEFSKIECLYNIGGVWASAGVAPAGSHQNEAIAASWMVFAFTKAIALRFLDGAGNPIYGGTENLKDVLINVCDGLGAAQWQSAGVTSLFDKFPKFILDQKITEGRLTSMSMLVTNSSADLQKQGDIYIARMNLNALKDFTDLEKTITGLPPNRRFVGPASTGGYGWWISDSLTNSDPLDPGQYVIASRGQESLFCLLTGLNPANSFLVTFCWSVEFYTDNQVFEKVMTPPMTEKYKNLFALLISLPACSCNPEHEATFSDYVKKAAQFGKGLYDHLSEHGDTYLALLALLAGAAA